MASGKADAGGKTRREGARARRDPQSAGALAGSGDEPAWLSGQPDRWVIALRAQPGARRFEIVGEHGGCLKVRIDAPAIEGRANVALLRRLAERLGLRVAQLTLSVGAASRDKRVLVQAPLERGQIVERLLGAHGP